MYNIKYIIYYVKGKGDMETYWLQPAVNDETKQEINSSDDENAVVEGLLVTSI